MIKVHQHENNLFQLCCTFSYRSTLMLCLLETKWLSLMKIGKKCKVWKMCLVQSTLFIMTVFVCLYFAFKKNCHCKESRPQFFFIFTLIFFLKKQKNRNAPSFRLFKWSSRPHLDFSYNSLFFSSNDSLNLRLRLLLFIYFHISSYLI